MATAKPRADAIVRVPTIHGGEPIVRGTRVSVRSVVVAFERYQGDVERTARAFTIEPDDVRAALAYYESHKAEIERFIEEREQAANEA